MKEKPTSGDSRTIGRASLTLGQTTDRESRERGQAAHHKPPDGFRMRRWLGAVILAVVIGVVIGIELQPDDPDPELPDLTVVNGYLGQLKLDFLNKPEVARVLAEEYDLRCDCTPADSIEMARTLPLGPEDDFLWLGDQSTLSIYRDRGETPVGIDNVFNSPLVLYSWAPIVDALVAEGVARAEAGGAYSIDMAGFVALVREGRTWADLGVPQLHGKIKVRTTDPAASTSGFLFAGLLANTLNGGDVVNATSVTPLLPIIPDFYGGFMPTASADLFEQFLTTGMGANPIVALYESQVIEFVIQHPSQRDQIGQQVRIVYPRPTVWTSHPFVARTANGARLLEALKDPDIQRLGWERNGFRPGLADVEIDPTVFQIPGILPEISSVIDMPAANVMDRLLGAIAAPPDDATTRLPSPPPAAVPATPTG